MFTHANQESFFSASTEIVSGNSNLPWIFSNERKVYNLIYPLKTASDGTPLILLGYAKRGMNKDKWNGFGGKREEGETNIQAAVRELQEESGLIVSSEQLTHIGSMLYVQVGRSQAHAIDCYSCTEWTGELVETDEMRPKWYSYASFLNPGSDDGGFEPLTEDLLISESWLYMRHFLSAKHLIIRADFFQTGQMARYYVGETLPGATSSNE